MPCGLVTLDVMDVSGEQQTGVVHGLVLTRLSAAPASAPLAAAALELHAADAQHLRPGYCGECYGAAAAGACCDSCDAVRDAYAAAGWAFGDGAGVEQCAREHYGARLAAQRAEGCNVAGTLRVNRVVGNFHVAPGKSFSTPQVHVHDLQLFLAPGAPHSFTHTIHRLRFGPPLPGGGAAAGPLDGSTHVAPERAFNFMYFIKVVGTAFVPLNGSAAVESHEFAVTSHARSLAGGADADHPDKLHARGGIPGVFFSYDISPMKVVNREVRERSFIGLLTSICAIIGGTLTVATVIDRTVYEGGLKLRKMHQG